MARTRVLVAMSGGVDSSVAAALLVAQGFDVVGATMKLFCHGDDLPDRPCCSLDSVNDARRVCERLGVPHYVLNLESAFGHDVVDDFVAEYARGRTPIPCVQCNTFTKFRDLVRKADAIDAPLVATGHYARVIDGALHRGLDPQKDQSYFLWGIRRDVLPRLLMPVGAQSKVETRAVARSLGLLTADKVESQDICFVPDGDHAKVIASRLGATAAPLAPGPIELADGTRVGTHDGYARYTIGQRRGLPGGFATAMFVTAIVPERQAVVIGPREALLGHGVLALGMNWLGDPPVVGARVHAQIRHRGRVAPAEVIAIDEVSVELALEEPLAAITPGQSLVLYVGDRVLGGGFIERAAGGVSARSRSALPILAA
ncbi:MAG: tRNA 2-thiouridine(34) synthase MnmA [Gemmatimonadaceae bacterium]|jgi:tRNA-specific 2-thiouridylase|nr:tRNA 2-thiouridine(34) synthase MnmA [Gemmatimonadaceae bacterium]